MQKNVSFKNIQKTTRIFDSVPGLNSPKIDPDISILGDSLSSQSYYCIAKLTSAQSIPHISGEILDYSDFETNTDSMAASDGQIIIPASGIYLINMATQWQDATGGNPIRKSIIYVNDDQVCYTNTPAISECINNLSFAANLEAGDAVMVEVFQDSGNAINVYSSHSYLQVISL